MSSTKFQNDLSRGEDFERRTIEYLKRRDPACKYRKIPGFHPPYDLICDHCNVTIECKTEEYAVRSGNFFFERGGLLNKCKAQWLYHEVPYPDRPMVYISRFRELKSLLRQWNADGLEFRTGCGDGGRQEGLVVPIDSLRSIWHIEYYEESGGEVDIFG